MARQWGHVFAYTQPGRGSLAYVTARPAGSPAQAASTLS
jgi:hypothetical protein